MERLSHNLQDAVSQQEMMKHRIAPVLTDARSNIRSLNSPAITSPIAAYLATGGGFPSQQDDNSSNEFSIDVGRRFGARLRQLRRSHNLTQLDLAVALGIDRCYLSSVECGKKGVSLATLEVIALGFRMKLSELLNGL